MPTMKPTPLAEVDRAVAVLNERKDAFARLPLIERVALLRQATVDTYSCAEPWVRKACEAKGLDFHGPSAAEEWLGGPMTTIRNLRVFADVLDVMRRDHIVPLPGDALATRDDGQVVAQVFPRERFDPLLYSGISAEVWMEPGETPESVRAGMGALYRTDRDTRAGAVALVLGAGNTASTPPMDVLYKMFVENQVCILKMNPVNDYVGPFLERGLRALIGAGFLRIVYGDAEVGEHLVHHAGVDAIHMTGSDRVHDVIVWGPPGPEQDAAKASGTKRVTKPITSELGCVTPVIVTPGNWSEGELDFQAQNVATMLSNNASFNCNAAKVIVTHAGWGQRKAFLERLSQVLAKVPTRKAYYPGADERHQRFVDAHPGAAKNLGKAGTGELPWTLIEGVDPTKRDDICFTSEAWCSILAETALEAASIDAFLDEATRFANEQLWGTLSCSVLASPSTLKVGNHAESLERAIAGLRYGSVAVNHWPALSYGLVYTTWGAFPGHTLEDIQSGIGVVHNALMFAKPQKSVIRGPFRMSPKPPWFVTNKKAHTIARRMTRFEHNPSLAKIPAIAAAALAG